MDIDDFLLERRPTVFAVLELFELFAAPEPGEVNLLEEIAAGYLDKRTPLKGDGRNKAVRVKSGSWNTFDITMLLFQLRDQRGYKFNIGAEIELLIEIVISRFREFAMVRSTNFSPNEIYINRQFFNKYASLGLLDNIVMGANYVLEKYKNSIPAINVVGENGGISCGSGILIDRNINSEQGFQSAVLTNRHVVEGRTITEIRAGDVLYNVLSNPVLCEGADLALVDVSLPIETPHLIVGSEPKVLSEVLAVGYPRVPNSAGQFAFAHKGEVNGSMKNLQGDSFLVMSCQVSPGNSGGPLLSRTGLCVGIVTRSNEGTYMGSDDKPVIGPVYHAAIPPSVMTEFLLNSAAC